jgi:hypothetical protein
MALEKKKKYSYLLGISKMSTRYSQAVFTKWHDVAVA